MDLDELCYRMKTKKPVALIIKKFTSYIPTVKKKKNFLAK
jgi:hypothetical protein